MGSPPAHTHTKALLSYLLANFPRAHPKHDTATDDAHSTASSSDPDHSPTADYGPTDDAKIASVLQLLEDDTVDDEDKPDALKDLLTSLLADEPLDLDPQILALLHRYREDLHPSALPVPPLTPLHPSVSRSSSFRRAFATSTPLALSSSPASASASAPASASASSTTSTTSRSSGPTSPFRSASPALVRSAHATPSHSPWSSPRPAPLALAALSATAPEFKFSAGASEFTPSRSLSSTSGGSASVPSSRPGTPAGLPRSPVPKPMDPHQAQAVWASTSSPLGTPKYTHSSSSAASAAGSSSAVSSPSYFPRHLDAGLLQRQLKQTAVIPRLPWADPTDSSGGSGLEDGDELDDEDEDDDKDEEEDDDDPEPSEYAQTHFQAVAQRQAHEWRDTQPGSSAALGADFVAATAAWDPFEQDPTPDSDGGYTPTLSGGGGGGGGGDASPFALAPDQAGLGGVGAYVFTPFDHLHSVFAGSDVSAALLEEALVMTGFDVDQAIEYIIDTQSGAGPHALPQDPHAFPSALASPVPLRTAVASGSRPLVVSRDSFDGFVGGNGGRGSPLLGAGPGAGQRWQARPQTPTNGTGTGGGGVGGRVCRYYLSGNCLRSDCKFSHDVGKAVCKFWLRGHCLKGDGRCDFLHSIPPIMRADFEQRARRRSASAAGLAEDVVLDDSGPDLDFPTLGEAPRSRRGPGGQSHPRSTVPLDPTRTRFSGAVKFGRTTTPVVPSLPLPRAPPPPPVPTRDMLPQPRFSARITLRPPALLPTLPTGPALSALYARYRASFLELGANRNKCLARAAESWKRGDGAGARKWSRDAADWNRQVAIEGRDSAHRIVAERTRLLKEAIARNDGRAGTTDDVADRKVRGRDRGGGVCLGVVSPAVLQRGAGLTVEERTEVALDLHGLHFDEASSFLGDFLLSLERERFAGLAFVVIGQAKHTGASDGDRGAAAGRLRLEQGCTEFLSSQGWPWSIRDGIITVDALR